MGFVYKQAPADRAKNKQTKQTVNRACLLNGLDLGLTVYLSAEHCIYIYIVDRDALRACAL